MPYDLFISYARSDNAQGRITELKAQIEADHRRFVGAGGPDLHVFFDTVEISGAYNWRYCMLDAILDSRLLLICLSPAYLESDYCAWELNEYLKHEAARSLLGDGVAPVYLVEIPGWTDKDYDQRAAKWVAELRRRRHFDLRSWSSRGPAALNDVAVLVRMDELNRQIHDRLTRIRTVLEAKGNVDRRNEHFKGRAAELRWLRESLGLGKLGVLTAVHGLGGMGKTALALEYAYAFAHEYPAGRWQVRCEGRDDLRAAVASLAGVRDLEFEFTDEEKNDLDLEFERVLRELKKRADASPAGRVLMILDNVDRPTLLEPAQTARLARDDWLHLVATTRLGEDELFGKENDRAFLPVDELSEAAAVELIESHQPGAKFRDAAERAAAEDIVRLVGRFTLAVEAAAVFLGQFSGDETCAGFRDRLKRKGLTGLDQAASATAERVRLSEKSLIATLLPTLERLGEPERLALDCAALLPADHVPLPWLRAVTATRFPDLGHDAEPGHPDPWQSVVRRLFSLRLLQPTGVCDDQRNALVVRMHRLVRGCVTGENQPKGSILGRCVSAVMGLFGDARRIDAAALAKGVLTHIKARAGSLWDSSVGHDRRWELGPLAACAWLWLERESADGADLANQAAGPLEELGKFAEAEPLYRRALLIDERCHGPKHPTVGRDLINLAELLRATNRVAEAEPLCRRALAINERSYGPDHPEVARALINLAELLRATSRLAEAEPLCRRALAISERSHGAEHPDVARALIDLTELLRATNRLAEAEPLCRRALAINEQRHGLDHPSVGRALSNLAELLRATNRLAEAEPLCRRALAINERSHRADHPDVIRDVTNLAELLRATNRLVEAEPFYRRALTIIERRYGPDHAEVGRALDRLALLLRATSRLAEAEPLLRRALAIHERCDGPDHPDVATGLNNLAELLRATDRIAAAELLYRRALLIDERSCGPDDPAVARDQNALAALLYATNRLDEAEPLYRRALAISERSYGPDHPTVAIRQSNLAALLHATNRLAEAEPLYRRALLIDERSYGPDHPTVTTTLNNLAELLQATNRLAEAEPLHRRTLASAERSFGPGHPIVAIRLNNLAKLLQATNRLAAAEPLSRRGLQILSEFRRRTGNEHPDFCVVLDTYRGLLQALGNTPEQIEQQLHELTGPPRPEGA